MTPDENQYCTVCEGSTDPEDTLYLAESAEPVCIYCADHDQLDAYDEPWRSEPEAVEAPEPVSAARCWMDVI